LRTAEVQDGVKPGVSKKESTEPLDAWKRIRLLDFEI
jgi:hypothetical protein